MIRLHEYTATDKVSCDTLNIDNGSTSAQIFIGKDTLLTGVYSMKSYKKFTSVLSDNMRQCGTMGKLIVNRTHAEISNKIKDVLRTLLLDDW